jgi:hypothetical protein
MVSKRQAPSALPIVEIVPRNPIARSRLEPSCQDDLLSDIYLRGALESAAHRFIALDHELTDWAKQLIAHARAALFVEQVKANVVVFDGRIELDRDGDQTEGEDATGDGPSHPLRVSCRWMADLRVADDTGFRVV